MAPQLWHKDHCLHFNEIKTIKITSNRLNNQTALFKYLLDVGMNNQIDVALAIARIHIFQSMNFPAEDAEPLKAGHTLMRQTVSPALTITSPVTPTISPISDYAFVKPPHNISILVKI